MARAKPRTTNPRIEPERQLSPTPLNPDESDESFAMPTDETVYSPQEKAAPAAVGGNGLDYAIDDEGLDYRRRYRGLIGVASKVPIRDRSVLSLVYTPGVAEACLAIKEDPLRSYDLTCRGNTVAILTDGSDILSLIHI